VSPLRWAGNLKMHLLILGATGRTGLYGYKYALEQGMFLASELQG
jgi:hypothetical protein